jgi:hypothetical protein
MCEPPPHTEAGSSEHTTVLQLHPVRYKVSLLYLGHDRIAHDGNYRCRYELQRGTATIVNKPDLIPNVVRADNSDPAADRAAKPSSQGGDATNPPGDTTYRIMITDNHALRAADDLLGRPDGDHESKPDNYRARNWLRDIGPAIPFRIVVKKYVGDNQVDYDASLRAIVEIKDPVEEFDQNDGARRDFLEGFFNKYNRTDADPDAGDDNAPVAFKGAREASSSHAGAKASDLMRDVPYASPPVADLPPGGTNNVPHSQLGTASSARDNVRARFSLVARDDGHGRRIGMTDVAFLPPAVGGDNYRFLITLTDNAETDVRDLRANGAAIIMADDADGSIPKPRAYVTGRFVVWRRVHFRLLVLVNNTAAADIQWANIQSWYAKAFADVIEPPAGTGVFNLDLATWRTELRREFDPGNADAAFDNGANFTPALYGAGMFPPFLQAQATTTRVENLAKRIIRHACGAAAPPINPAPGDDTGQDNDVGLFMMFCKLSAQLTDFAAAGAYLGDRMFWFAQQASPATTTSTTAHELGHALYLRHSHTVRPVVHYTDTTGATDDICLADGRSNNNLADHDQDDAFACLMSYTRPATAQPCGLCALTLRMYDRVAVQRSGQYRNEIMEGLRPVTLVHFIPDPAPPAAPAQPVHSLDERLPPELHLNRTMDLMAVGPETPFTDRAGTNWNGRTNVSCAADNPASLWSASGAGGATVAMVGDNRARVTGTRLGRVTVSYRNGELTASMTFEVIP